jgi:hypothetical protein
MCCGQKRSDLQNSQAQRTPRIVSPHVPGNSQARAAQTQPSTLASLRTVSQRPPINTQMRNAQPNVPTAISMPHSSITVRYRENSPIRVRGAVSGIYYEFSGSRPVQLVDARDASSLLNTRFFCRA